LDKGAKPDLQSSSGWTALMDASSMRRSEVVKLLLDKGANPNLKSKEGKTVLDYADNDDIKTLLTSYMKRQ
jgi:ankyrin repeat protein